jgi:hypothetical protein
MVDRRWPVGTSHGRLVALCIASVLAGCAVVPGSRLDESQRLVQSLRAENARLKEQVLGLEAQNRDYADRALDDLRRLSARDQAIERLERSVQSYQDDRDRLAAAYGRLTVGLGRTTGGDSTLTTANPRDAAADARWVTGANKAEEGGSEGLSAHGDGDAAGARSRALAEGSGP